MRRGLLTGVFILLLVAIPPLYAQDQDTPVPPNTDAPMPTMAPTIDAAAVLSAAEEATEEAGQAVDMAFNLLGLFEALGLLVAVGGGLLAGLGFTNFNNARRQLEETRKNILSEFGSYRESFNKLIEEREAELATLRTQLEKAAIEEREQTSNALLANAMIPIGERQYKFSDYPGALSTYNRALELDPINPVVHQKLAYVYTQQGELNKAKYHYEKAVERAEDFAPALAGLGFVYRRMGENVEQQTQQDASPDERRAAKIEQIDHYNRAEHLLTRALRLSPKLVDDDGESWWGVLGGLYKRRDQIEEAISAYKEAAEVTPQSSYGYVNLAQLYLKQHEREQMQYYFERVERIARKEAEAEQGNFWGYADLIVSSYAIGKIEQAEEALPTAIAIAPPDSPYMLAGLRDTLSELQVIMDVADQGPIKKAIDDLNTAIKKQQHARATV